MTLKQTMSRRSVARLLAATGIAAPGLLAATATGQDKPGTPAAKILDGAEPFAFEGGDIGVLVIHGFTGTTQSMRYLGEQLHKRFGFTVSGPRLAGHGTSPDDMATTRYLDWVGSAEAALNELASRKKLVFVTGLSMGGAITLNLAARFPDKVAAIAPINAIAGIVSDGLNDLMMDPKAPEKIPGIGSDIKAQGVTELAYKEVPVAALRDIYLLQAITANLLQRVTCPALIIQSKEDHVVDPRNGTRIKESVKSEDVRLLWLENSFHVATLDNDKDLIADEVGKFFKEIAQKKPG
jgi:carboxylesterase